MTAKDRFPGLRSFEKKDADLFFGRGMELLYLSKMVRTNRVSLLFGPSGVGKSSLLNTAFIKEGNLEDYVPVRIRFTTQPPNDGSDSGIPQLQIVKKKLRKRLNDLGIELEQPETEQQQMQLWELAKYADRSLKSKFPQKTIVFLFDQFEEFFTHFKSSQDDFCKQLAELCHELLPVRIMQDAGRIKFEDRSQELLNWFKQPDVRILFSIRSDRLFMLNAMAEYLPSILANQFDLRPFDTRNAQKAIIEPCSLPNDTDEFNSPPIILANAVLEKIIAGLSNELGEIECSFLQIVCYTIEQKVKTLIDENDGVKSEPFSFDEALFDKEIDMNNILDGFYQSQLQRIADPIQQRIARVTIEDFLVNEGQRTILLPGQLKSHLRDTDGGFIKTLLDLRLIRVENMPGKGLMYELSHEKLVAPIQKSKNVRLQQEEIDRLAELSKQKDLEVQEKEEQLHLLTAAKEIADRQRKIARRALYILGFFLMISVAFIIFILYLVRENKKAVTEKGILQANTYYSQNNHSVAFALWDRYHYFDRDTMNKDFENNFFFYDISGGDHLVALSDSRIAVHHRDNTILVWTINTAYSGLHYTELRNAANMEVSDSKRFLAYRSSVDGSVYYYDARTDSTYQTDHSQVNVFASNTGKLIKSAGDASYTDYKMGFVKKFDFISFTGKDGFTYLYDPVSKYNNRLDILAKVKYTSTDIRNMYNFSLSGKFVGIVPPGENRIEVYRFRDRADLKYVNTVYNVRHVYYSGIPDSLIYLSTSGKLYIEPFNTQDYDGQKTALKKLEDLIMSPDGTRALILESKNKLVLYSFKNEVEDTSMHGKQLLSKFYDGIRIPILKSVVKWNDAGNMFSFRNYRHIAYLIDLTGNTPQSYIAAEEDANCNYIMTDDGYKYILSQNGALSASIDATGRLTVKDIIKKATVYNTRLCPDAALNGKDVSPLNTYNLEEIIRFSQDGKRIALIRNFNRKECSLEIYNLASERMEYTNSNIRKIGQWFTSQYIQAINNYNTSGGLIFLNDQKRDLEYFRKLYPKLNSSSGFLGLEVDDKNK